MIDVVLPGDILLVNGNVRCDMLVGRCRCGARHGWPERLAYVAAMPDGLTKQRLASITFAGYNEDPNNLEDPED